MPSQRKRPAAVTVCNEKDCPELTEPGEPHCVAHTREPWREARSRRPRTQSGWDEQRQHKRILRRDRGMCWVCGLPGANEVDHVVPVAAGGSEADSNKRAIHATCNLDRMRQARGGGVGHPH